MSTGAFCNSICESKLAFIASTSNPASSQAITFASVMSSYSVKLYASYSLCEYCIPFSIVLPRERTKDLPNYVYIPTLNLVEYIKSLNVPLD